MAKLLTVPDERVTVTTDKLHKLASQHQPAEQQQAADNPPHGGKWIDEFISRHGSALGLTPDKGWKRGGRRWNIKDCPMCSHGGDGTFLAEQPDGPLLAGCHHDSCNWNWHDLRAKVEPKIDAAPLADISTLVAKAKCQQQLDKDADKMPDIEADSLINSIVAYNLETAYKPQPALALAGAIAYMGALLGRKVCDARNTRTNVYVLGVAPSGAGKEHARDVNKRLDAAIGHTYCGAEGAASMPGICSLLQENPSPLMMIDEAGKFFQSIQSTGGKHNHRAMIGNAILSLYSASKSQFKGDVYAQMERQPVIQQPNLCVYGTTTPKTLWDGLNSDTLADGLLGRLLYFEGGRVKSNKQCGIHPPPDDLAEALRYWHNYQPPGTGNLNQLHPQPAKLEFTPDALRLANGFIDKMDAMTEVDDTIYGVWQRAPEKTAKLALIFACSRTSPGQELAIQEVDVDAANRLAEWNTALLLNRAGIHLAENKREQQVKRVRQIIWDSSAPIKQSVLTQKTRWIETKMRKEILEDLQESGEIVAWRQDTGKRPAMVFARPDTVHTH